MNKKITLGQLSSILTNYSVSAEQRHDILAEVDRQCADEPQEPKALASATCSAARVEKERALLLWMQLLVGLIGYQPGFPLSHKQELADAMARYEKALDAVESQNKEVSHSRAENQKP